MDFPTVDPGSPSLRRIPRPGIAVLIGLLAQHPPMAGVVDVDLDGVPDLAVEVTAENLADTPTDPGFQLPESVRRRMIRTTLVPLSGSLLWRDDTSGSPALGEHEAIPPARGGSWSTEPIRVRELIANRRAAPGLWPAGYVETQEVVSALMGPDGWVGVRTATEQGATTAWVRIQDGTVTALGLATPDASPLRAGAIPVTPSPIDRLVDRYPSTATNGCRSSRVMSAKPVGGRADGDIQLEVVDAHSNRWLTRVSPTTGEARHLPASPSSTPGSGSDNPDATGPYSIRHRVDEAGQHWEELLHHPADGPAELLWAARRPDGHRIAGIHGSDPAGLWSLQGLDRPPLPDNPRLVAAWFDFEARRWRAVHPEQPRDIRGFGLVGNHAVAFDRTTGLLWEMSIHGDHRPLRPLRITPNGSPPRRPPVPGPDGRLHGTTPPPVPGGVGALYAMASPSGPVTLVIPPETLRDFGDIPSDNVVFTGDERIVAAVWSRRLRTLQVISCRPDGSDVRRVSPAGLSLPHLGEPRIRLLPLDHDRLTAVVHPEGDAGTLTVAEVRIGTGSWSVLWTGPAEGIPGDGILRVPGSGVLVLENVVSPEPMSPGRYVFRHWIPDGTGSVSTGPLLSPGLPTGPGTGLGGARVTAATVTSGGRVMVGISALGARGWSDGDSLAEVTFTPTGDPVGLRRLLAPGPVERLVPRPNGSLWALHPDHGTSLVYPDQDHHLRWGGIGPRPLPEIGSIHGGLLSLSESGNGTDTIHRAIREMAGPDEQPVELRVPAIEIRGTAHRRHVVVLADLFRFPPGIPPPRVTVSEFPRGMGSVDSNGEFNGFPTEAGEFHGTVTVTAFGDPAWTVTSRVRWILDPLAMRIRASPHRTVAGFLGFTPRLHVDAGPTLPLGHRLTATATSPPGRYQIVPFVDLPAPDLTGLSIEVVPGELLLVPDRPILSVARPGGRNTLTIEHPAGPARRVRIESGPDPVSGPWTPFADGQTDADRSLFWILPDAPEDGRRFYRIEVSGTE